MSAFDPATTASPPHLDRVLGTVAVISLAVALAFADRLEDPGRLVNFGALTGFLLLHLAVVNHFIRRGRSDACFRHGVAPMIGVVILAFVIVEMDTPALICGGVWLALGVT